MESRLIVRVGESTVARRARVERFVLPLFIQPLFLARTTHLIEEFTMKFSVLILVAILEICSVQLGSSIECYKCKREDCPDAFNETTTGKVDCSNGVCVKTPSEAVNGIQRFCADDFESWKSYLKIYMSVELTGRNECHEVKREPFIGTMCVCDRDLCNDME